MTKIVVLLKTDGAGVEDVMVGPFDDIRQAFGKFTLFGLKLKKVHSNNLPIHEWSYEMVDNPYGYDMVEFHKLVDFDTAIGYMSGSN